MTGIREIELRDVPQPAIEKPDDVLLRVEIVGVCGSDMHYYRTGRIGDQVVQFPYRLGHECAATVVEVGPEVRGVAPGDRVAVDPLTWCEQCDQCLAGREHTCRNQTFLGCPGQAEGCMADLIVMAERSLFKIPDGMTWQQAALVEPFAIGLYAQRLAGEMTGKTVGVFGSGPIGLCVLAACKAAGASKVYATDIRDYRCEMAARMGADWTGNPEKTDVAEAILAAEPLGVDYAFECCGEQSAIDEALRTVRPGGKLLIAGIPEVDRTSFEAATMRRHEVTIQPVRRQNQCEGDAIAMVAAGEVDLDPMVTHNGTFSETKKIYDLIADYRDNAVKAMIYPD
jgi:L-iditol 2-dehydrogenase